MQHHFIFGGGLRVDYLITPEGKAKIRMPGGNAVYAAVGAALWHKSVAIWARKGTNFPDAWLRDLSHAGVDLNHLITIPSEQDHRTFFAYRSLSVREDTNPAAHFARIDMALPPELADYVHSTPGQDDPEIFEPLALRPSDWNFVAQTGQNLHVHLAPLALATHVHTPPVMRASGVKTITVDPGERYMIPTRLPTIKRLLPQIDAFLPSDKEVRSLLGSNIDLWAAADSFCAWGAPLVVIKNGPNGVLIQQGPGANRSRAHIRAYHQPGDGRIVDVTGAGDAFCGGFLAGLATKNDPLQAARMGVVSASLVIEGHGAAYALQRGEAEAKKRFQEIQQMMTGNSQ